MALLEKIMKGITMIYVIWFMYYMYQYIWHQNRTYLFESVTSAKIQQRYVPQLFTMSSPGRGVAFSCSFWMYVDEWAYNMNHVKPIFEKGNLKCYLNKLNNELVVEVPIYGTDIPEKVVYDEIPLQKWFLVTIVLDGRMLDIWLNDKLYASKYLKNVPKEDPTEPLLVTPNGGFSGYLSRFYFYDKPLSKRYITWMNSNGPISYSPHGLLARLWLKLTSQAKIATTTTAVK